MNTSVLKRIIIFCFIMCCVLGKALANSYYASMTAKVSSSSPTGAGTVYVDNNTDTQRKEAGSSGGNVSFELKATANTGYEFINWSETDGGSSVSTNNPWTITVKASTTDNGTLSYTRYAAFASLPIFYFSASAVSTVEGETATVNYKSSDYGAHSTSTSGTTVAIFSVTTNTGYVFDGWSTSETGEIVSADNPYSAMLTSSAKTSADATTVTYYARFSERCLPPTITSADATGGFTVTLTHTLDVTIYYTTDGSEPSATNGIEYNAPFFVTGNTTVKAVAILNGVASEVASKLISDTTCIKGTKVILNDYEDHTWTYYAGVNDSVDGGDYNTNYVGKMYSPDPRNVKITYQSNGGAVSISEAQNEFVYYKTIEKVNNAYKYQVISNPFSKRPTGKGFGGWQIVSGGNYIDGKNNNDVLALDEELTLVAANLKNLAGGDYTPNCTSAEIVLKATWVDATIVTNTINGLNSNGTYETNLVVLTQNSSALSPSYPCTIMMVAPDGSADYRTNTLTGSITPPSGGIAKVEYASWNPNGAIAMAGRNLWIGRGVTCSGTTRSITLAANNGTINQVAKIESGSFTSLTHYSNTPSGITKQILVLGNDYDRANSVNNKLTFSGAFIVSNCNVGNNYQEACRVYSKSGSFMTGINISTAAKDYSYYMSRYTTSGPKRSRYIEIEGGEWYASINGGQDNNGTTVDTEHDLFVFRMRGGKVRGCVYGAAEQTNSSGNRVMVFTGGQVGGWICGASNGTSTSGGILYGKTFVYFGGNAECNTKYQERTPAAIRNSLGGYVYGCGCGSSATSHVGEVNQGTNVVMADNAKVQYGVYGGGAYGYSSGTANVYVTGGHVESSYDASYNVYCGVYGGARQNDAGPTNVYMTGGLIEGNIHNSTQGGGLFGGCNAQGDLTGSVNMVITGGQVGTTSQTANIHGGGYGSSTSVSGNVDIKLGADGAPLGAAGVVVYGDVYGGSALGTVNTSTSNHTNVTLNAGTVNGNIFGGGLGNSTTAADVKGNVAVTVNGGSLNIGGVFGCNNQNGTPIGTVTVTVNHTNPSEYDASGKVSKYAINAVYGGGNQIAYSGKPVVHIVNCDCSIKEVYGGGNAADVGKDASAATSPHTDATDVTIDGGEIDYAFGGGNGSGTGNPGANVKGNANLKIGGGTINNIFGGSNTLGDVYGNANVTLEDINPDCPITVDEVYGGANRAPMAGKPVLTINCIKNKLSNVYGGSKAVDVNSDIVLNINSGQYGKVFGGNNESGAVKGSITVNIDETGCHPIIIDELYAGGNMAAYTTPAGKSEPTVNVISCTHIGQVFGGGYGKSAVITGDPIVNINQIPGKYDPEDKDASDGYSNNTNGKLGTIGTVFGGGNAANVVGNTHVNIGTLEENAHLTTPTTKTKVGANITGNVYGGGNAADVTGRTNVTVGRQKN